MTNILELPKPQTVKFELPLKEAHATWHSLKTMLDNNIPPVYEIPLLFRSMETIAKAIDEASNEKSIS